MSKPKIYLTCFPGGIRSTDFIGYALAEDGTELCSHLSSNKTFSQHDLGLTSNWKHKIYNEHYPDGYELEWVEEPHKHKGWESAMKLNKVMSEQ